MRQFTITAGMAALVSLSVLSKPAQAQVILDFTGGAAANFAAVQGTAGWEFDVRGGSVTVNAIGFWDEGGDGLVNSHQVGLWDIGQNLLRSGTVTNASTPVASTSPNGRWLFTSIPTITLETGTYVLAAFYDGSPGLDPDAARLNASSSTIANVFFVNTRQDSSGTGLTFPGEVLSSLNDGAFGPNLAFIQNGSAAPEPGTLALLATGVVGGLIARRKRK